MRKIAILLILALPLSLFAADANSSNNNDEEMFIVDKDVQIKSGYGLTSERYVSFEKKDLGRSWKFKKRGCFDSKMNKFNSQMSALEKSNYEYVSTETYINTVPSTQKQVASFLVTFVKDTYEGNWLDSPTVSEEEEKGDFTPRVRPADFLVYKIFHFECELEGQTQINDDARKEGKDISNESSSKSLKNKSKTK